MPDERPQDQRHGEHHEGRVARLIHRLEEDDPNPRLSKGERVVMTAGPLGGFGAILLVTALVWGVGAATFLASMELVSFIGGGKFVIFGPAVLGDTFRSADFSPWALAGLVVYGDIGTCLIMMANMTLLYRTPWLGVGRRLALAHEAGWYMLHVHRWMRRAAWLGVAVFVAAPFQGTGAVIGTIIARILGLSRWGTLSATAVGSAAGCSVLALLGDIGRKQAETMTRHPVMTATILAVILVALVLLGRWFMGHAAEAREQFIAEHEAQRAEKAAAD